MDPLLKIKIDSFSAQVVKTCSNQATLQQTRDFIPISSIVQDNLDILDGDFSDNLLPHLVRWFSEDFFKWFSAPPCDHCGSELTHSRSFVNIEGKSVETYCCPNDTCSFRYDFIRHNDPAILLHTRQGRCGEWANCFQMILSALDYDSRVILDTTDHVWNEVWSETQKRWLHVDPCEGVIDNPLIYEVGWGKKLQYCLAFSQHEVLDVTARYSKDFAATKSIRNLSDEEFLASYLNSLTDKLLEGIESRERIIERRRHEIAHLSELSSKKRDEEADFHKVQGRKTGSIRWRIERGEFSPIIRNLTILRVSKAEKSNPGEPLFSLKYHCDSNRYLSNVSVYQVKNWSKLVYLSENLDFKYEKDWKTSYIARYETCSYDQAGIIQWRFDVSSLSNDEDWTRLNVTLNGQTYPNTSIKISLTSLDGQDNELRSFELELNNLKSVRSDELDRRNCKTLTIEARLEGGMAGDPVAWQKPQLFRQARGTNTQNEWPFIVEFF